MVNVMPTLPAVPHEYTKGSELNDEPQLSRYVGGEEPPPFSTYSNDMSVMDGAVSASG